MLFFQDKTGLTKGKPEWLLRLIDFLISALVSPLLPTDSPVLSCRMVVGKRRVGHKEFSQSGIYKAITESPVQEVASAMKRAIFTEEDDVRLTSPEG